MAEPYCLAMVLCDNVHQDATTGKFTLLGTFSSLFCREFPAAIQFCIYFAVTDGLGPVRLSLRLVDSESDISGNPASPIFDSTLEFDFGNDPLMVCESRAFVQALIPRAGVYHCELLANDIPLMSRRMLAIDVSGGEPGHE